MALFRNLFGKNSDTLKFEAAVVYNAPIEGSYNENSFTLGIAEAASPGVNYINGDPFKIAPSKNTVTEQPVDSGIWALDIAQSHHFVVKLEGIKSYYTPHKSFDQFLPVKSIQLNQTSYENMSIPLSIFGDFPLLNKKRVSTIGITCYDEDSNIIERQLRAWEKACFPSNKYVAYMSDIARKLTYIGYNVKGQRTLGPINMYVIPSGNITVSRDYSANDAKLLTFTLVCVGDGSSCATGRPAQTSDSGKVVKPEAQEPAKEVHLIGNESNASTGHYAESKTMPLPNTDMEALIKEIQSSKNK